MGRSGEGDMCFAVGDASRNDIYIKSKKKNFFLFSVYACHVRTRFIFQYGNIKHGKEKKKKTQNGPKRLITSWKKTSYSFFFFLIVLYFFFPPHLNCTHFIDPTVCGLVIDAYKTSTS